MRNVSRGTKLLMLMPVRAAHQKGFAEEQCSSGMSTSTIMVLTVKNWLGSNAHGVCRLPLELLIGKDFSEAVLWRCLMSGRQDLREILL
jgi:hypothetical protein